MIGSDTTSALYKKGKIRSLILLQNNQVLQEQMKQVKPIGFEAPRGGAYNNRKHLKLETPCS